MTQLNCSVNSCANNRNNQCCLAAIQVEGVRATSSVETLCDSFLSKKGGENLTQYPNDVLNVHCKAKQCVYNQDGMCDADSIGIAGNVNTQDNCETACASFCCK